MKEDSGRKMKRAYWFFTALALVIIGLLIAVIVLVTADDKEDKEDKEDNPDSPNIATTLRLNDGKEIPIIGIGTVYASNEARQSVMDAIDRGYRHFDTAYIYGTEVAVGEGVGAKINEGVVTRENLFVTSKLWKTFMHPQLVRDGLNVSLTRLNLTYIDLYLIHWPMNDPETTDFDFLDTWRVLEELVDEGLVKSIGVSNFNASQIDYIIDNARIKPVLNQVEVHPHCLNKRIIEHCHSRNVAVTAYSPLGAPGHPQFTSESRLAINEPKIRAVAQRHRRTPAQIMIRYHIQNGNVAIPKTVHRDRVITNFDVFNFSLSDEDIREIESIGYYYRRSIDDTNSAHHQYPFATYDCL